MFFKLLLQKKITDDQKEAFTYRILNFFSCFLEIAVLVDFYSKKESRST